MGLLEEWGDALVEEGLREAAETFFGARKALEDRIAVFERQAAQLATQAGEIQVWFSGLGCLLGGERRYRALFDALGVLLEDEQLYGRAACSLQFRRPRALTRKGLFVKTVWEVYESLARQVDAYMHGVHYQDALRPGRMLLSVHYEQLARHCEAINARVAEVNEAYRPSESLGFAKRMDVEQVQKESLTGGGGQTWSLDRDMAFAPVDFSAYALPRFPDLPVDAEARKTVQEFCARIVAEDRDHVVEVLEDVFRPENKNFCVLERT